jgi:predicted SAM-dependent methyltransferase
MVNAFSLAYDQCQTGQLADYCMELELPITELDIVRFIGPVAVPEQAEYLRFHLVRYRYLLDVVASYFPPAGVVAPDATKSRGDERRILDIGTGFEVDLLRQAFKVPIDTAGFQHSGWPAREGETFYELNLNETDDLEKKVDRKYPLIVMAEVLEHVYTAPELFLSKMKHWLQPGGFLIVQTPNAVFLPKRIKMLFGIHPFEKIRRNAGNPGHFREYTLSELIEIAHSAGFSVVSNSRKNYFSPASPLLRLLYSADFLWPPGFRAGITMVLKNGE